MTAAGVDPAVTVNVEAIPASLRERDQWVTWKLETRDGKPTKVPYNARTGQKAMSDTPATWSPFLVALRAFQADSYSGIGFVFSPDDPYCGIDLDHALDDETGELADWARDIVGRIPSYAEWSPSGQGVHIILEGALPAGGRKKGRIEVYGRERYFTVTGRRLATAPESIQPCQVALDALHADVFRVVAKTSAIRTISAPVDLSDVELIERAGHAKNGANFSRLWSGDTSGYDSQSNADIALCEMLAFWTQSDAGRIDRLFRQSGLMRDKWEAAARTKDPSYGAGTIREAIERCTEHYSPGRNRNGSSNGVAHEEGAAVAIQAASELPDAYALFSSGGVGPAPALDLALLPTEIARVAADAAERMQVPADYVAWPLLVSTFGLIGRGAAIRPRQFDDWTERLALWVAIVGESGELKTPALGAGVGPLKRQQVIDRKAFEKRHEVWKEACKDERGRNPKIKDADLPDEPAEFRWIVEDVTVERLAMLLTSETSRGLTMYRDELASVMRDLNRYRDGAKGSDRQFLLEAYVGGPKRVDRMSRPALFIEDLLLNLVGGVQPDVAREMFSASLEDGLNARFTTIWPDPLPSWEQVDRWPNRAAIADLDRVNDRLAAAKWADVLLSDDFKPTPYARFSADAQEFWNRWYAEHMREKIEGRDASGFALRRNKYSGLVARLAMAFHLHEWAAGRTEDPQQVDVRTLARVLQLVDHYLIPMDRRVYGEFGDGELGAAGRKLARHLLAERPTSISVREVYRHHWQGMKTPKDSGIALEWLAAQRWVYELNPDEREGRPSKRYGVNPKIWEMNHD